MWSRRSSIAAALILALLAAACARRPRTVPSVPEASRDSIIRVAIAPAVATARVSATALLSIVDGRTSAVLAASNPGAVWTVRVTGDDGIELSREGARPVTVRNAPVLLKANAAAGAVVYEGRRYRGSITMTRSGDRIVVVNNIGLESYLRSVVALEIGNRTRAERAAIAAQSISARSFTLARLATRRRDTTRRWDMLADVSDQAYGGMDAEIPLVSEAVDETAGLVVKYGGRIVEAVYSSSCGGTTADAAELWIGSGQPYLKSVSDRIPGRDGFFCDIAPRFTWSATLDRARLAASLDTYLRNYVQVNGAINWVDSINVRGRTASGRVAGLTIATNAGKFDIAGDRIRFVLRPATGEIVRSTLYEISAPVESGAGVTHLELRGKGYGHGAGLCQWGAIGRARAGHSYRDIIETYYTGAKVERVTAAEFP